MSVEPVRPSPWSRCLALMLCTPALLACSPDGIAAEDGDDGGSSTTLRARGDIELTTVVVNQGVDVPIAADGEWVPPEGRNSYVVANRDALIRAFWTVPDDWEPREITARLTLEYPDGTVRERDETRLIEGPAFPGDFERNFFWDLLADDFPNGLEFHVELFEADSSRSDIRESTTVLEAPSEGLRLIGVQPEPAQLKVVFVPVRYDTPGCSTDTSQLSEDIERRFLDALHEQNPVQEVLWDFRRDDPIVWTSPLSSLTQLWEPLNERRSAEAAPPNTYYYALVDPCTSGIDGAAGIAMGTPPPTKAAAFQRTSSGIWNSTDYSYLTFVHEVGHSQGRRHVFCEGGDAAGVDPAYPHENGVIGVWGFGIRRFALYSPTATFDYMTYCGPRNWSSDWTWSKNYEQIRALTGWDFEGPAPEAELGQRMLVGLLFKDGSEQWWTTEGAREPEYFGGGQTLSYQLPGGPVDLPAGVEILEDGTQMVLAPLPDDPASVASITGITRIDAAGVAHVVELASDKLAPR